MFFRSKKIISFIIVFIMLFSYSATTIEAVAATDVISVITNGFFNTGEMNFNAYFDDETSEKTIDVNEKATLILEIEPNSIGDGFLKSGTISAIGSDDTSANFKFASIKNVVVDEPEENEEIQEEQTEEETMAENNLEEETENIEEIVENTTMENNTEENIVPVDNTSIEENAVENTTTEEDINNEATENSVEDDIINNETENENIAEENVATENTTIENTTEENIINEIDNTTNQTITSRSNETREETPSEENTEELINEEEVIEENRVEETYEELTATDFEIELDEDNQINIQNVIYNTKIEVEIEYTGGEEIEISELYKQVTLKLNGTYINTSLEKIETEASDEITVGFSYHKEFDAVGQYTQFSPFELGENKGIIVESQIVITRETDDEKYLPIKETIIEIDVPEFNGNQPEKVDVQATKLMATKGEDTGELNFDSNNWNYDAENKKITIVVGNSNDGKAVNLMGQDEYSIVYRYNDYTEEEKVSMDMNVVAKVEEYSGNSNIVTTKELHETQEIETEINNLITYNIGTTDEAMNKAKINANYNSEQALYETEFITTVNVNILTSDLLEEFKLNSSKEVYLDQNSTEFDASADIYYKKIKFNYDEIKAMLQNEGSIEIQNMAGNVLCTLNNDTVQSQEACEIPLTGSEHGLYVVFKNISVNGNINIEFTKSIGKSVYNKSAFCNFKQIRSTVSAEIKYKMYEDRYGLTEISTVKKMSDSKTVAEIDLSNNNLNTTAKNDGVELRIVLNNDKEDSDLYINPSFELVFPKYVKSVTVENISLMNELGLEVGYFESYIDNGIVKIRIDLAGTQTMFSSNSMSGGTNIMLTLNIELDEYTPKKQEQIKMYYCNEGVTTYESQTVWTVSKSIPNGIIKQTNGFDVAVINYQAPNGFVSANSIVNYDGQNSKISSINQGDKTIKVEMGASSKIATMELVAMNNTGNTCTDVVLMGRIPFQDNTSVVDGRKIGTNVSTLLTGAIEALTQNEYSATIYYSTNANATKELYNSENNWSTNVVNWENIKSYMIIVQGEIKPGTVLQYNYNFVIPGNLEYDQAIYGNFASFYNNNYSSEIKYESSEADLVGLITEEEPDIKVTVAPYGGNENIYYGQILTLVATVENIAGEKIDNGRLLVDVPSGTVYTELRYIEGENIYDINDVYVDVNSIVQKEFTFDNLDVGDKASFEFTVRVLDSEAESENLEGFITAITNKTLTDRYSLKAEKENIKVTGELSGGSSYVNYEGSYNSYNLNIENLKGNNLGSFDILFELPEYLKFNWVELKDDSDENIVPTENEEENIENTENTEVEESIIEESSDEGTVYTATASSSAVSTSSTADSLDYTIDGNTVKITVSDVEKSSATVAIGVIVDELDKDETDIDAVFDVLFENKTYSSNVVTMKVKNINVSVTQEISALEFDYGDEFSYQIMIKNETSVTDDIRVTNELPINLKITNLQINNNGTITETDATNYMLSTLTLQGNGFIEITANGVIDNDYNDLVELNLSNIVKVDINRDDTVQSNELNIKINAGEEEEIENTEENIEENTEESIIVGQFAISGTAWIDSNQDGIKDTNEGESPTQIQVQLLKSGSMMKATSTNSLGYYEFSELEPGDYTVIFNYDKDMYSATKYNKGGNSQIVEVEDGVAVTDVITITDSSIENVNPGLQEKDRFDFNISQYISKATVIVNDEATDYEYDDLELAQLAIEPSDLDDAIVKFEYKIVVENVGNVDGQVTSIVDYIPNGLNFDEKENVNWSNGVDGNIYTDVLRNVTISPGESKTLVLILSKKMSEDNTGVISNKAKIAYTQSSTRLTEAIDNNFASQETIVTVTQGGLFNNTAVKVITISLIGVIAIFGLMIKTGKIEVSFNLKNGIKKIYK